MAAKSGLEKAFEDYDPEKDPTGAIGRKLAELKLQRQGYTSAFSEKRPIKEIIKLTPKEISSAPNVNYLIKTNLDNLKKAGYDVNIGYFKKQDKTGKWNYFIKILADNDYFKQD